MVKDRNDRDDDKPDRHEDDREGQVHEDTAKNIDPRGKCSVMAWEGMATARPC